MKAHRAIRRSDRKRALVTIEMSVAELHEVEALARAAGLTLDAYIAAVLLAGDRTCEHGVSVLATGAAACIRCSFERREIAQRYVTTYDLEEPAEPQSAPTPATADPDDWTDGGRS